MDKFIERLKNTVCLYPNNIAISLNGNELVTYKMLYAKATLLAEELKKKILGHAV